MEMRYLGKIATLLCALAVSSMNNTCRGDSTGATVRFYEYIVGYSAPVTPKNEISERETADRIVYYKIIYDANGKVIKVTKIRNSKLEYSYEYEYDSKGVLISANIVDSVGTRKAIPFGKNTK